jgi:hypothetical protein
VRIAYTGARLLTKPERVHAGFVLSAAGLQPVQLGGPGHGATPAGPHLKDLVQAAPAGGLASGALSMYRLGNTTSHAELVQLLTVNNVTPAHAQDLAGGILDVVRSTAGKAAFLGLAGGAATWGVLEVVKPGWSWKRKLAWSAGAAALLAALFLILARLGILR